MGLNAINRIRYNQKFSLVIAILATLIWVLLKRHQNQLTWCYAFETVVKVLLVGSSICLAIYLLLDAGTFAKLKIIFKFEEGTKLVVTIISIVFSILLSVVTSLFLTVKSDIRELLDEAKQYDQKLLDTFNKLEETQQEVEGTQQKLKETQQEVEGTQQKTEINLFRSDAMYEMTTQMLRLSVPSSSGKKSKSRWAEVRIYQTFSDIFIEDEPEKFSQYLGTLKWNLNNPKTKEQARKQFKELSKLNIYLKALYDNNLFPDKKTNNLLRDLINL